MSAAPAGEAFAHEVSGPAFTPLQTTAGLGVGIISLLISGVLAVLLGALAEEHRLSASAIGLAATLEALSTGVFTGLASALVQPRRLRTVGACAAALTAALDLATTLAHGGAVLAIRGAAGAPEGVLLWISVSMIARTTTPERWAAAFYTGMTLGQLVLAVALASFIVPLYGANGGYVALAIACGAAVALSLALPPRFGDLPGEMAGGGPPPLSGWIALSGALFFTAAASAVGVYMLPLAIQAHLTPGIGRTAVAVSLAFQVVGGALALALSGKVHYGVVFAFASVLLAAGWVAYGHDVGAAVFIAFSGAGGLAAIVAGPFLTPMLIEADPSRRSALQSGGAQLLGGALGPLIAAFLVSDRDVRHVLWLGGGLLTLGLAVILAQPGMARRRRLLAASA